MAAVLSSLQPARAQALTPEEQELEQLPWMARLTITCLATVILGWLVEDFTSLPLWVAWLLYTVSYASGGYYSVLEAWDSLKQRQFDVNMLMILAALGAAYVGHPREGAVLMFLFSLSNTLETYAMGRTHASIRALIAMAPTEAEVYRSGLLVTLPVEQVQVGDLVLVRPGARLPADGLVEKGESAVNESSITGESIPVEKAPGAKAFAGTLNGQGALELRVTTPVSDSALARIVRIVSEARERKAKSQDFTDRVIGQYYAYAVVGITLLAIAIPLLFLGWDLNTTLYRAMTLMVVASPCALVISIPAALLSALASAARGGVLFKGGVHLEAATDVKVVALDKTGTVTTGRPEVVAVVSFVEPQAVGDPAALGDVQREVLALAAAVEHASEHPLARAIVRSAEAQNLPIPEAHEFLALTGAGASATVAGQALRIGRPTLFGELSPEIATLVHTQEEQGRTVVLLGAEQPLGLIAIADTIRPQAAAMIQELRRSGIERVVLLTGDNRRAAQAIGASVGVDEVHAELLPEQKVAALQALEARYGPVVMVGDGVNDAPALATAKLGVAMGAAGADVALESADMLLMGDELRRLPWALRLARRVRAVVRQNLVFAGSVMVLMMIWSIFGNVPLTLGVLAHEGGTLLVVLNGLRLLLPE